MTAVSENLYIGKLDDIINECNNTYHRTIKMKPIEVKDTHILTLFKKLMIKILYWILYPKLVIMLEYQNTKSFLRKDMLEIGLKKFL